MVKDELVKEKSGLAWLENKEEGEWQAVRVGEILLTDHTLHTLRGPWVIISDLCLKGCYCVRV